MTSRLIRFHLSNFTWCNLSRFTIIGWFLSKVKDQQKSVKWYTIKLVWFAIFKAGGKALKPSSWFKTVQTELKYVLSTKAYNNKTYTNNNNNSGWKWTEYFLNERNLTVIYRMKRMMTQVNFWNSTTKAFDTLDTSDTSKYWLVHYLKTNSDSSKSLECNNRLHNRN